MSDPERLSHERVFDGKVFDVDRDRVRMPNGREVTVDVVRHSAVGRADPGAGTRARHPDPAVPVRREPLAVGAAGRQRGRRRAARGRGAARMPRGDRPGAGHDRAARRAATRRRATATRRCSSSGCPGCPTPTEAADAGRGRGHRAAGRSRWRDAREMVRRGEIIGHEDGGGADADLSSVGSGDRVRIDRLELAASVASVQRSLTLLQRLRNLVVDLQARVRLRRGRHQREREHFVDVRDEVDRQLAAGAPRSDLR